MRLWHTKFIEVLPRQQLVAQWREISSIVGAIQKNGTPNHILVNFVTAYDYNNLISYAYYVREEMKRRGYRTMESVWQKIASLKPDWKLLPLEKIYETKMSPTYLTICYYNLFEKYLCLGISDEEWKQILKTYNQNVTI